MKKIAIFFLLLLVCLNVFSQYNQWVWMHGDNTTNKLGVFGTKGIPSPANKPGARYQTAEWTDLK